MEDHSLDHDASWPRLGSYKGWPKGIHSYSRERVSRGSPPGTAANARVHRGAISRVSSVREKCRIGCSLLARAEGGVGTGGVSASICLSVCVWRGGSVKLG